jgi:succinoglycan biosynthesis protein ExoM
MTRRCGSVVIPPAGPPGCRFVTAIPELPRLQVSIITCRRPAGLRRLLTALQEQNCAACRAEVLVVDNDAAGSAAAVLEEFATGQRLSVRYEQEEQAGIVFARNRCVEVFLASENDALVFIDDDEWPADAQWLDKLSRAWQQTTADVVTSHVVSVGEAGVPGWALDIIYGENRLRPGEGVTKFYTNNLLLSRAVLATIRPAFDARFAMTGASDYHFALKCTRGGFRAVYADAPVVEEFPKDRATLRWFLRRGFRSGSGHTRSHVFEEGWWSAAARALFMALARAGLGTLTWVQGVLSRSTAKRVLGLFRLASAAGTIAGLLGITHEEYRRQHTRDMQEAAGGS